MFTFFLLVALGLAVGLLAVALAQGAKPATDDAPRRRDPAGDRRTTSPEPRQLAVHDPGDPVPPDDAVHAAGDDRVVVLAAGPDELPRRRRAGAVPARHVAVEGRFADIARARLRRRAASLLGIVVLCGSLAVGISTVIGVTVRIAAAVLDRAVG